MIGVTNRLFSKMHRIDSPVPPRNVPHTTAPLFISTETFTLFKGRGGSSPHTLPTALCCCRSTILQQQFNRVGHVEHGSVALPGIIRSGSVGGPENFNLGSMPSGQQQITTGQMHRGHMPPLVGVTDGLELKTITAGTRDSLLGWLSFRRYRLSVRSGLVSF